MTADTDNVQQRRQGLPLIIAQFIALAVTVSVLTLTKMCFNEVAQLAVAVFMVDSSMRNRVWTQGLTDSVAQKRRLMARGALHWRAMASHLEDLHSSAGVTKRAEGCRRLFWLGAATRPQSVPRSSLAG